MENLDRLQGRLSRFGGLKIGKAVTRKAVEASGEEGRCSEGNEGNG